MLYSLGFLLDTPQPLSGLGLSGTEPVKIREQLLVLALTLLYTHHGVLKPVPEPPACVVSAAMHCVLDQRLGVEELVGGQVIERGPTRPRHRDRLATPIGHGEHPCLGRAEELVLVENRGHPAV